MDRLAFLVFALGITACSSDGDSTTTRTGPSCQSPDAAADATALEAATDAPSEATEDAPTIDAELDATLDATLDANVTADAATQELRIMTYNIKHGDVSNLQDIAAAIRAEDPDLVGLQEVDVDADRSGNVDQAHRLSQLTGMTSVFGSAPLTFSSGDYYGLALLSRLPILSSTKHELTSGSAQRILVVADVLTDHGHCPWPSPTWA